MAEKIVSGKDGTVTEAPLHSYGIVKGAMNNNFVDDTNGNMKLNDVVGTNPTASTKVVHTMHINGTPNEQAKVIEM